MTVHTNSVASPIRVGSPSDAGGMGLRVLIADDHDLVREAVAMFLRVEGAIEAATVSSLDEVVVRLRDGEMFDVILLDYSMPGMNGLEGMVRIQKMEGAHRVVIISGTASPDVADEALKAGAAGFLPKTLAAKSLVNAIRFIAMGEQYAPLEFLRSEKPTHPLAEILSQRELEVLEGLTKGKSNKEIARDLDIREPTVKLHIKTLYRKIGADNRTKAAMIAREQGLF